MFTYTVYSTQYLEKSFVSSVQCSFVGIKGTAQFLNKKTTPKTKDCYHFNLDRTKESPLQNQTLITQSLYLLPTLLPATHRADLGRLKPHNLFFQINVFGQIPSVSLFLTLQFGHEQQNNISSIVQECFWLLLVSFLQQLYFLY